MSRRLLEELVSSCGSLRAVSFSRSAYARANPELLAFLEERHIRVLVSSRGRGRPSLLERRLGERYLK